MVKRTAQTIYHSGDVKLTEYPTFLYEVQLYLIRKDGAGTKFFSSLKVKESQFIKMDKEITCAKYITCAITWIGAPLDYLRNNNFKVFNSEKARQRRKSNTRSNK